MAAHSPSSKARLPAHLALRIALAARALKNIDTAHLLRALIATMGEPITEARLAKLRISRLRTRLLDTAIAEQRDQLVLSDKQLHSALGLLKGRGVKMPEAPLPTLSPYQEGDLPDSVRVACTSNSGEQLDGIFSNCSRFLIYQISPQESRLIDIREPSREPAASVVDRYAHRTELIEDCQLLYTLSIGGPAAAKVIRAGIHPIKLSQSSYAREVMEDLQRILGSAPPPWLAKVMGTEPTERVRFPSTTT